MDLTLPTGKVITLNSQQKEALALMHEWWKDPLDRLFLLMGYAGTGKTTISKAFLDVVRGGIYDSIAVSAPTHKAKAEIQKHTGFQYEGETLQGLLGLAPDISLEDFDPNKPEFTQKNPPKIGNYRLILIDEASMMNTFLFETLCDAAEEHNTQLMFICDPAQLPPVKEIISPIISSDRVNFKYELTHVERQAGDNPLMFLLDRLRNNLRSPVSPYGGADVQNLNDIGEGFATHSNNIEFARTFLKALRDEKEPGSVKMLAFWNKTVRAWNNYIRRARYGENPDLMYPGEVLLSYSTSKGKIINSGEYIVRKIEESIRNYSVSPTATGVFRNGFWDDNVKNVPNITIPAVRVYTVTLYDMYNCVDLTVDIVHPEDVMILAKGAQKYMSACYKNRPLWRKYLEWRAKFYCMEEVEILGKMIFKLDLTYGYVMTIHKSQGSTYEHVFVDDIDICRQDKAIDRNKMRYVANSRPRKTSTILVN